MKRGMETIQLVVSLVIGLVVLLLVIGIISGKLGGFAKATTCTGQGSTCIARTEECPENTLAPISTSDCQGTNHCCLAR